MEDNKNPPLQPAVDIATLAKHAGPLVISVSPQETQEDADHRRWKDKILFVLGVASMGILFLTSLGILAFGSQQLDEKKLWIGLLASLATGFLGFVVGKKS